MRTRAPFVVFLIALVTGVAMAAPAKLVYRIDRATATIAHHSLVVTARGAVSTGGWIRPSLRVREAYAPDAAALEVEFVATPPRHRAAVAHAILPVSARFAARSPHTGVVQVKIVSQTNSVTVPILRLSSRNGRPYAASATTRPARLVRQSNKENRVPAILKSQAASATTRFRPVFLAR